MCDDSFQLLNVILPHSMLLRTQTSFYPTLSIVSIFLPPHRASLIDLYLSFPPFRLIFQHHSLLPLPNNCASPLPPLFHLPFPLYVSPTPSGLLIYLSTTTLSLHYPFLFPSPCDKQAFFTEFSGRASIFNS